MFNEAPDRYSVKKIVKLLEQNDLVPNTNDIIRRNKIRGFASWEEQDTSLCVARRMNQDDDLVVVETPVVTGTVVVSNV